MDQIIYALKLQHQTIELLRKGMNLVQDEPKEATENLQKVEDVYQDALVECGRLAASNNGFNRTPPEGVAG
jgi:DNA-binding protein H-NS